MVNSPKCAVRLQSLLRLAVVSHERGKKVPAFFRGLEKKIFRVDGISVSFVVVEF